MSERGNAFQSVIPASRMVGRAGIEPAARWFGALQNPLFSERNIA